MRDELTIWLDMDGRTLRFSPGQFLAKWTVGLPPGAKLVSIRCLGVLVQEQDGRYSGLESALAFGKDQSFGYEILERYDPDCLIETLNL